MLKSVNIDRKIGENIPYQVPGQQLSQESMSVVSCKSDAKLLLRMTCGACLPRLVVKHRMISIGKTCFSLKINISIHNWTSKKICSIRYTQYVHISFWTLRKWLYLRPQNSTRSPPPKAADFFGCFFRLLYRCFPASPQWNMKISIISNGT